MTVHISETIINTKINGATCGSGLTKVKYFTVTRRHVSPHILSQEDVTKILHINEHKYYVN